MIYRCLAILFAGAACVSYTSAQDKAVSYSGANRSPDSKRIAFTRMDITQSKTTQIEE